MRAFTNSTWSALALVCFAIGAFGQDAPPSINGPVLGFVADASGGTIQPIIGVLGASVVGRPLALDFEIRNAVISPKQNFALATWGENAEVVLIRLGLDSATMMSLGAVRTGADLIAISPSGTAAAAYTHSNKVVRSITRLADAPEIVFEFDLSDIEGRLQRVSISDDGALALLNFTTVESSTLWAVNSSGARWVLPAQYPSAATFLAGRHDAVIADDAAQEVFVLRAIDQDASRISVASFGEGFDGIAGVAASPDGLRIFITSKKSENVTLVDLNASLSTALPCHCAATGLHPLKGTSVFRLNDPSNGAIAVLDASSSEPRIIVVPVTPAPIASNPEGIQKQ
jgi:hypothetical protein